MLTLNEFDNAVVTFELLTLSVSEHYILKLHDGDKAKGGATINTF